MASPFSVFRKNQKYWMAGLVVMAMIAFVFMPQSMTNSFRGGGGAAEEVRVQTTKFGNLTARQVQVARLNRTVFIEFLQRLSRYLRRQKAADRWGKCRADHHWSGHR